MKRLFYCACLLGALLVLQPLYANTEAEVEADLLAERIIQALEAKDLAAAAELFERHDALGVSLPHPLVLPRAGIYVQQKKYVEAEGLLKEHLKQIERGSDDYRNVLKFLVDVRERVEAQEAERERIAEAERRRIAAEREAKIVAKMGTGMDRAEAEREVRNQTILQAVAGYEFQDCDVCPRMVKVPAGSFMMGSPESEEGRNDAEGPVHGVEIAYAFAVGVYEVTFDEWDACVAAGGCSRTPRDGGWGRGKRPVIYVSRGDAQEYVLWLSSETGESYRLLSESEWEYVARAGTTTRYHFGDSIASSQANYGESVGKTVPVGSYPANQFGLHDVHGNVWEWVQDCWNDNYRGAPNDGSAWESGNCSERIHRGGSWSNSASSGYLSSAHRHGHSEIRESQSGFRVARVLTP